MNLIIMILLDYLNNPYISKVDYDIAQYIIHNPNDFMHITITQMADLLGVTISQISRFVRHIGFDSFLELKESIEYHGPISRHSLIQQKADLNQDNYQKYIHEEIDYFFENFQTTSLHELVDDMMEYSKICLIGSLNSGNAARELQYNLMINGLQCLSIIEQRAQIDFIEKTDSQTLIIIYSLLGEYVLDNHYLRCFHTLSSLKKSKAKIYVMTHNREVNSLTYIDRMIYIPIKHRLYQYTYQCLNDSILLEYQKRFISKKGKRNQNI